MKSKRQQYKAWVARKPRVIRVLATKLKPWHRYRVKTTGQLCTLYSMSEDGTATMTVQDRIVPILQYNVFGLKPGDLERAAPGGRER